MPTSAEPPERLTRAQQQHATLEAFRAAGGDRASAAERLGLDAQALENRLRELGIVRQAAALTRAGPPGPRGMQVRRPGERVVRVRPSAPVPPPLPKRGAGRPPKGRVSLGASAQRDRSELQGDAGRALLGELIRAHRGHGPTLLRRLNDLFVAPRGRALTEDDLGRLLERHGLQQVAEKAAAERLLVLLEQHRGDLQRIADTLKVSRSELCRDLVRRGQWENFERARDRYRRDVFAKPLGEQAFLLLERRSMLSDLGALADLDRQLGEACRSAWAKATGGDRATRIRHLAALMPLSEERAVTLAAHFHLR
jgi:hypothetical protein